MKISNDAFLKVGKLPAGLLPNYLDVLTSTDPDLVIGPGIGFDCAVIDIGERYMIVKSDPITFATKEIGWYAVQIISNDIYTTGADPKWLLPTIFLPENLTTIISTLDIAEQLKTACEQKGIIIAGGHTEITARLDRPIIACTAIGFIEKNRLLSPRNIQTGDQIILTKGIPIEGVAILANEFENLLKKSFPIDQIKSAKKYIHNPGISVEMDKKISLDAGIVHAMHDPTEGGLSGALWELSDACNKRFHIDPKAVMIPLLAKNICNFFGIDPWSTIASGALLIISPPIHADSIVTALIKNGIWSSIIGRVEDGEADVQILENDAYHPLTHPERDEIARLFEAKN